MLIPFDKQLVTSPSLQMLYPKRALAVREGFVPVGKLDLKHITQNRIIDGLKGFLCVNRPPNRTVPVPGLGGLYSFYGLLQAGFETRIVEEINYPPLTDYLPNPNAFAVMAKKP